jgi:aminocarboxymuconate-semialdehyde decarboxylase
LTYYRPALLAAIDVFGAGHVVLGSDYPFAAMPDPIEDVVADLPADLRHRIGRTNMEGIHGALLGSGAHPLPAAGRH